MGKKIGRIPLYLAVFGVLLCSIIIFFSALRGMPIVLDFFGYEELETNQLVTISLSITAGLGAAVFMVVNYRKQSLEERKYADSHESELVASFNEYARDLNQQTTQAVAAIIGISYITDKISELGPEHKETFNQRCVDILCSFLRSQTDEKSPRLAEIKQSEVIKQFRVHTLEDAENSWSGCTFNLPEIRFFAKLDLRNSVFDGLVDFNGSQFERSIDLSYTKFSTVNFDNTTFMGEKNLFIHTKFRDEITFTGNCKFMHDTYFNEAVFPDQVVFGNSFTPSTRESEEHSNITIFYGNLSFQNAHFGSTGSGSAYFNSAMFRDSADFSKAHFGSLEFVYAQFEKSLYLDQTTILLGINLEHASIRHDLQLKSLTFPDVNYAAPELKLYKTKVGGSFILDEKLDEKLGETYAENFEENTALPRHLQISEMEVGDASPSSMLNGFFETNRLRIHSSAKTV
ncbi:pentapeptide repeat-containing protein [Boudabousia marimammalium]|uniref:Pentapeptide repeat-containing protein n=1 Tax=Boudabousia marimammalium TaxID=156892 RepID=A0A1Q5PSZ2_9ACTO|nr:pentapeptide repeat-containing protein [Boudabousia marimammalium]OKL50490.1 hypothetical protein BM477_00505 [Boudabousia marimammalium]